MKNLMTLAAMFAVVAMSFSACNKENPDENKGNDGGNSTEIENVCPDCGEDPCVCGSDYDAPIKIDGEFADWDALDANNVASTTCNPDAMLTALSHAKVYADQYFVYVYFEFVEDEIIDTEDVPFHIYLDADNSDATGGYGDQWTEAVSEWNFEGFVMSGGSFCSYDPGLYLWEGEPGENGWLWSDSALYPEGSGIGVGTGKGNKYEFSLNKEVLTDMEVIFENTFGIGFDIQQTWDSVGILPNAASTDDNPQGLAPLLRVNIVK